jgi:hypothetical protein
MPLIGPQGRRIRLRNRKGMTDQTNPPEGTPALSGEGGPQKSPLCEGFVAEGATENR